MATGGWVEILGPTISVASIMLSEIHRMRAKKKVADTLEMDLAFIKEEFKMMQSFLMDADEKRSQMTSTTTTTSFKAWFRRIRDLAQNVEDNLQEFFLHLEKPSRASSKLLPLDNITKQMHSLTSEIEHVNKSYGIYANAIFCLNPAAVQPQSNPGTTVIAPRNSRLIGREMEKSHLIQLISQNCEQCQITSIWGMIGIGKTSLVRSIFESEEISSMFQTRAWITISHPFNLHDFVTSLSRELSAHNYIVNGNGSDKNEESIKATNRRRCLIVLDDVLSIEEWNLIQPHLPGETNTHIIVITKEASISEYCSTYKYKLECLKENAAFALFKNKVFMDSSNIEMHLDMTTQAKLIIKECDGHPLAITSIGGFLARKPKTATEWKKLTDDFCDGSGRNKSLEIISTALAPAYDDLPCHLKLCLLYLSVFPKGHNIRRKRLVRRWVAEGYTSKTHNLSEEEVGESYFTELMNRNIVRPSKTVTQNAGTIGYCQVHNLIHKISISKSMEENHGFVLDGSSNTEDTMRHLSIIDTGERNNTLNCADLSHVRSLTVFGEWRASLDASKMRLLRVLDLEGTFGLKDHDLSQIGNFLHLTYLSLRGCADIYQLPDSVGNLWDIQVLDVSGTSIIKLPKTITKLKKLQYLRSGNVPKDEAISSSKLKESSDISKLVHEAIDDVEMPDVVAKTVQFGTTALDMTAAYCTKIVQNTDEVKKRDILHKYCNVLLPSILWGLDMNGVKAPDGIGQLNDLQTLGVVNVAAGKAIIRDLEKLKKLHKLGLTGVNKKNSQAVLSAIANLALLHSLSLRAEGEPGLQGCLDHKFSPPSKLQSLKIYGNLVTLPTWITQLQNLAKLKLRSTQLKLAPSMEILGNLPNLAILRLWKNSFVQSKKIFFEFQQGTFPSLVVLEIKDLEGLESLRFMQGTVPKLELLQVENCIHVQNNGFSGLSFPPSLREVMVKGDYNDKFIENLRTQLAQNKNQPVLERA
uniref:NB-ARC domain-containing protein n=1 Tax=Leersia perrieri TaxID=77586 RepID=A0A0D9VFY8_9ORYZ